jgi:hypothetical protein
MLLKANEPVQNAIIIYILCVFIVLYTRPSMFYDENGNIKIYGLDVKNNKTIFPFPVFLVILSIFIYLFMLILSSD